MDTIRRIFIVLCIPLLGLSLLLVLISLAITTYLGTPTAIKKTLATSHIYDHAVSSIIASTQQKNQDQNQQKAKEDIPFDIPEVKAAAEKSISPQFIQKSAESLIDGIYGWLDGTTAEPQFTINVSEAKTSFIENVATAAVTHVEALPVCTTADQIPSGDNPFDATCRPPNFNAESTKQEILSQVNASDGPLAKDTFTFADMQGEGKKPITEDFSSAPKAFQTAKRIPLILAVISLIFATILFLLHRNHSRGLKTTGKVFLTTGITVFILSLISRFGASKANFTGADIDLNLQQDLLRGFKSISDSIGNILLIGSLIYIFIGVAAWLIAKKLEPPMSEELKENNTNTVLKTKELTDKDSVVLENPTKETPENKPLEPKD